MKQLQKLTVLAILVMSMNVQAQTNTFPASGNVGIGTTSADYALEIVSNQNYKTVRLGGNLPLLKFANTSFNNGNGGELYQDNSGVFRFNVTSYLNGFAIQPTERFDVPNQMFIGGNVGIGTSQPGIHKLAVEGTIGARKVKVTQSAWADYVFEPTYQLPPLQEVESFIKANKHLPGVPSAKEVEKEGLDIGDNQATLLKKIEELTLYAIEMQKQLEKQQKQIAELQQILTEKRDQSVQVLDR